MSTFLELCQETARESGVVSGTQPTSVTGQTGDLLKIVNFVIAAWRQIQESRTEWLWMRAQWEGDLAANTAVYTAASFSLTRHAAWIGDNKARRFWPMTIYLKSTGVSDEGSLREIAYQTWLERFDRGTQTADKPSWYAISDAGELCFGPKPDAIYTVRGWRRKSPQILAANGDTPECPSQFHRVISCKARMLYAAYDEAGVAYNAAEIEYKEEMAALERDQLPRPNISARPLA